MPLGEFEEGECISRWKATLKDPVSALKAIGAILVEESQEGFRNEKFGGVAWTARANPNVYGIIADLAAGKTPPKRRFQNRPVLKDTGRLRGSINFRVNGVRSVTVGSNLPYAGVLHHGGPIESEKITGDVRERLYKWLKGKGKKWASKLGWLLNKKFKGETLKGEVEARPFVGLTDQSRGDILEAVGLELFK